MEWRQSRCCIPEQGYRDCIAVGEGMFKGTSDDEEPGSSRGLVHDEEQRATENRGDKRHEPRITLLYVTVAELPCNVSIPSLLSSGITATSEPCWKLCC